MQNILFFVKKNVKDLVIFVLIIVCLGFISYNYYLIKKQSVAEENYYDNLTYLNNNPKEDEEKEQIVTPKTLNVDVKGALKKPGVYRVAIDAIINDVISLAGGFKSNAYTSNINLSKRVSDEMVIYVYTKAEMANAKNKDEEINNQEISENIICKTPTYNIQECLDENISIIEVGIDSNISKDNNSKEPVTINKININTANINDFTSLTGIGEAKAKTIVEYRSQNGEFKNIEDIKNVKGIGDALFEKIKDYITV